MRTAPKVALSLLISLFLFSGLAVAAYTGLFNVLETRFYQPTVISSLDKQLGLVSETLEGWHSSNAKRFESFVGADPVKRSLLPNQSSQDIFDRTNLAGALMAEMPGLEGIRIVDATEISQPGQEDKGLRRIHFSTFREDILKKEDFLVSYQNYGKDDSTLPFKAISIQDGAKPKLVTDPARDAFVYCFPFRDAFGAWRGTAAFYVSGGAATDYLVTKGLARVSDDLALVSGADGAVIGTVAGMPVPGRGFLANAITDRWARKDLGVSRLISAGNSGWVLLSRETGIWGFTGELVREELFVFPQSVRLLFLAVGFLTIFLVVFFLFNLRQDGLVVIRHRIKRFQFQLLSELVENTDEVRWEEIGKNLAYRKHDINATLSKSFGRRLNKKYGKEIEELLEKSWDEILASVSGRRDRQGAISNAEEIRLMLEQVLQNNAISLNLTGVPAAHPPAGRKTPARVKTIEPATERAEIEDLEEIGEAEEVDEVLEDLEEIEEAEEAVEEVEDLVETEELAEELETLEEVEDAEEPVEEAEDLENVGEPERPVEDAMPADGIEEIAGAEEVAELDGVASSGDIAVIEEPVSIVPPVENAAIFTEIPFIVDEQEPEDAEFIDGKWEPEELIPASETETLEFTDEPKPDQVLVYNFDEIPTLDSTRKLAEKEETQLSTALSVSGLDFSSLDSSPEHEHTSGDEEATAVDYIDTFLLERAEPFASRTDFGPVYEFLEIVGDIEAEELEELGEDGRAGENAIVSMDGIYFVAAKHGAPAGDSVDREFKELVDSVLF